MNSMNATNTAFSVETRLATRKESQGSPLLSPRRSRLILLEQLSGWAESAMPGTQLYRADGWCGTMGYFAIDASDNQEFIKNRHVAGKKGDLLLFLAEGGMELGRVKRVVEQIACEARPGIVNAPDASCKIDHAFAELPSDFSFSDVEPRSTPDNDRDNIVLAELGDPLPLDCKKPLSSHSRCQAKNDGGEKQKARQHLRNGGRNENGNGDILCCHRNLRVFLAVRLRQRY